MEIRFLIFLKVHKSFFEEIIFYLRFIFFLDKTKIDLKLFSPLVTFIKKIHWQGGAFGFLGAHLNVDARLRGSQYNIKNYGYNYNFYELQGGVAEIFLLGGAAIGRLRSQKFPQKCRVMVKLLTSLSGKRLITYPYRGLRSFNKHQPRPKASKINNLPFNISTIWNSFLIFY